MGLLIALLVLVVFPMLLIGLLSFISGAVDFRYNNTFWMPFAYSYEWGFRVGSYQSSKDRITKNAQRFGR